MDAFLAFLTSVKTSALRNQVATAGIVGFLFGAFVVWVL